jgi:hypothetical protein
MGGKSEELEKFFAIEEIARGLAPSISWHLVAKLLGLPLIGKSGAK